MFELLMLFQVVNFIFDTPSAELYSAEHDMTRSPCVPISHAIVINAVGKRHNLLFAIRQWDKLSSTPLHSHEEIHPHHGAGAKTQSARFVTRPVYMFRRLKDAIARYFTIIVGLLYLIQMLQLIIVDSKMYSIRLKNVEIVRRKTSRSCKRAKIGPCSTLWQITKTIRKL
ncbi:hypothetical protein RUM43_013485 [Polyplax serrata]|uniref:Uncharacterized protein n=1 Tax=Polyplax serrata TaxID=468196 RepID=A0AAN8RYD0_POLSC